MSPWYVGSLSCSGTTTPSLAGPSRSRTRSVVAAGAARWREGIKRVTLEVVDGCYALGMEFLARGRRTLREPPHPHAALAAALRGTRLPHAPHDDAPQRDDSVLE